MSKLKGKNTTFSDHLSNNQHQILNDLQHLLDRKEITFDEARELADQQHYEAFQQFLGALTFGVKPENATGEVLKALLRDILNLTGYSEVSQKYGFADFTIQEDYRNPVAIELKPLFRVKKENKKLRLNTLAYQEHTFQIQKYLADNEYIILTNLKDVFIFNREALVNFKPFYEDQFINFLKNFTQATSLWDYLRRLEDQTDKDALEKAFFKDLKKWYYELQDVALDTNNGLSKEELSVLFLNKMIFIKTLEDFGLIRFKSFTEAYEQAIDEWAVKGLDKAFNSFFDNLEGWFWDFYNTELFKTSFWRHVKNTENNLTTFRIRLERIMGIGKYGNARKFGRGMVHYNYRLIDEDVFGKAYETFIAENRKEEGIYYTPQVVTNYMAKTLVDELFKPKVDAVLDHLDKGEVDEARKVFKELKAIKIIDIASGSGSFLIKTLREIYRHYQKITAKTDIAENNKKQLPGILERTVDEMLQFRKDERLGNPYHLISAIILNHIYAVEKDERALDTAKTNLWKEAIKLEPRLFEKKKLGQYNHILPTLTMNFIHGDSLLDFPLVRQMALIQEHHAQDIAQLQTMRADYFRDPFNPDLLNEMEAVKAKVRETLKSEVNFDGEPLFFALEFFYVYFDENGASLTEDQQGFDGIIGNPPYERVQQLSQPDRKFYNQHYETATQNYDIYVLFVERGMQLLKDSGRLIYIQPNKFFNADYGKGLRRMISQNQWLHSLLDFKDYQVFDNATTYTCILQLVKAQQESFSYFSFNTDQPFETLRNFLEEGDESGFAHYQIAASSLSEAYWSFSSKEKQKVFDQLEKIGRPLGDFVEKIFQGIVTSADPVFILEKTNKGFYSKYLADYVDLETGILKPILKGKEISRYKINFRELYAVVPYWISKDQSILLTEKEFEKHYPKAWDYLKRCEARLRNRENGKMDHNQWFAYVYPKNLPEFSKPKILTQVLANKASMVLDQEGKYAFVGGGNAGGYGIVLKPDAGISYLCLLGLLNSNLLDDYLQSHSTRFRGGYYSYSRRYLQNLPICIPPEKTQEEIESLVKQILELKAKDTDTHDLEKEIDGIVEGLYGVRGINTFLK